VPGSISSHQFFRLALTGYVAQVIVPVSAERLGDLDNLIRATRRRLQWPGHPGLVTPCLAAGAANM